MRVLDGDAHLHESLFEFGALGLGACTRGAPQVAVGRQLR